MAAILGAISVIAAFEHSTSVSHAFSMLCISMLCIISTSAWICWRKNPNHDEFSKIYNHLQAMAAILDAILKIIAFPMWDLGGILVCYL